MKKSLFLATALLIVCETPPAQAEGLTSDFAGTWVNDTMRTTWSD